MRIRWRGLELPNRVVADRTSLSDTHGKFYAEPFQYTAARGRSLSIGFTVEAFNLLKLFK